VAENAQVLSIALFFVACMVLFSLMHADFLTSRQLPEHPPPGRADPDRGGRHDLRHHHGGIDLSVGSQVALVNAVAAMLLAAGMPWPLVVGPDAGLRAP
jgi:simple sugar transport system permease protein